MLPPMLVRGGQRDLEWLDAELARLGRGAGATRLRLGELLERIYRSGAHHELGFSSMGAYVLERCERTARWASDTRAVARGLGKLPRVRQALLGGELSWSMAELLSRHAKPEAEDWLLERARGATVRAMRRELERAPPVDEDEESWRTITLTVARADAWALELTRVLLAGVSQTRSSQAFVEAMLAEGLTALQGAAPRAANDELDTDHAEAVRQACNARLAALRAEAEEACEARVDRSVDPLPRSGEATLSDRCRPRELDRLARELAHELAARDLLIGELFRELRQMDGVRRLGWATEGQYARERLGLSHSSLKTRLTLSRRSGALPLLSDALRTGRIGFEAAILVARVARPATLAAWIERARERTIKHLREEIDAVEMVARASADASVLVPPDDETMEAYFGLERHVLSGLASAPSNTDGQMSGGDADAGQLAAELESQMSGGRLRRGAGKVTVRLRVREALYQFWRDLEARHRRSGLPGSFVGFLCVSSWLSWAHAVDARHAYAHIYARDGYRCSSPVCPSRCITPHHFVFRSHGGGDEPENVGSLCLWCHLIGIHEGKLKAEPPASRARWTFGTDPIMVVEHRRRILLDEAAA